jgi:hypothetical protein
MNTINDELRSADISASINQDSEGILSFLANLRFSHWMLLIYPIFLFAIQRKRDFDAVYEIDQSAYLQIGFAGAMGVYMMIRILKNSYILKQFLFRRPLIWLCLYFILAIFSTAWADKPEYTLYRSFEALVFLLLIIDALASLNFDHMLKFQALFGLDLVITWQFTSLLYDLSFESLHNSLVPGSLIYFAFLGLLLPGKRWKVIYAIIIASIILATSAASYLALLFGIGGVIIFSGGKKRFLGLILIIFTSLLIWTYGFDFIDIVFRVKSESNIMTATGRVPVWQWVYDEYVVLKPYWGYGFGAGETLARLNNLTGLRMMHMHSVVMSALTNLGFVGLTLFFIFILDTAVLMIKEENLPYRALFFGATFALLFNALSIASLTAPVSFGFIGQTLFFVTTVCVLNDMNFNYENIT